MDFRIVQLNAWEVPQGRGEYLPLGSIFDSHWSRICKLASTRNYM